MKVPKQNHSSTTAEITCRGRAIGSQCRVVCAKIQDAAKVIPCIKGIGNLEHFAVDFVSFLDAKYQTQNTVG